MVDDFPLTLESGGIVTDPSDPLRFGFKFMGGIDLTSQPGAPLTASAAATVFFKTGLANGRPKLLRCAKPPAVQRADVAIAEEVEGV